MAGNKYSRRIDGLEFFIAWKGMNHPSVRRKLRPILQLLTPAFRLVPLSQRKLKLIWQ